MAAERAASATSGVIGFPAATNGWIVHCDDLTTQSTSVFITKQTASSATTATITQYNTAGAATAWVASDILHCMALLDDCVRRRDPRASHGFSFLKGDKVL